ncbi:MAG: 50S ribosomal protein L13 [Nanoarchaeota archaeon]|nr:50S ribosomal protein L13 [Nanoarchaeota archaeon]
MIIDGKGIIMGRLASFVAKQALKGEDIKIINCEQVLITGKFETTKREFEEKRSRFGHSQKGPKHLKSSERIVKRAIRGMLPNHREGRGKIAINRIRCYNSIPKELIGKEITQLNKVKKIKSSEVREFAQ